MVLESASHMLPTVLCRCLDPRLDREKYGQILSHFDLGIEYWINLAHMKRQKREQHTMLWGKLVLDLWLWYYPKRTIFVLSFWHSQKRRESSIVLWRTFEKNNILKFTEKERKFYVMKDRWQKITFWNSQKRRKSSIVLWRTVDRKTENNLLKSAAWLWQFNHDIMKWQSKSGLP